MIKHRYFSVSFFLGRTVLDRVYSWISCDLKSRFPLFPHNIPELQHTGPGPPTPRTDGPHACYQNVLFVTKEKGRPVLTLHTGLLLKRGGGGVMKKARITKEKGRPVLTLHTGLLLKRGGGSLGKRICVP